MSIGPLERAAFLLLILTGLSACQAPAYQRGAYGAQPDCGVYRPAVNVDCSQKLVRQAAPAPCVTAYRHEECAPVRRQRTYRYVARGAIERGPSPDCCPAQGGNNYRPLRPLDLPYFDPRRPARAYYFGGY